jgi:hypothetical protein
MPIKKEMGACFFHLFACRLFARALFRYKALSDELHEVYVKYGHLVDFIRLDPAEIRRLQEELIQTRAFTQVSNLGT